MSKQERYEELDSMQEQTVEESAEQTRLYYELNPDEKVVDLNAEVICVQVD
jgi:hypothetical protein